MGGGSNGKKYVSVKDTMLEVMKIKEMVEINEYRRKMNFPAEVERTSSISLGSSSQSSEEDTATPNKSSTYNKAGKRSTRLVRSV